MLFLFCWRLVDAAARCTPYVKALSALGVTLFFSLFLLCRVRALLGACWCVTDGATMDSSGDNSSFALDTHPHTLYCLPAGVIATGHCCSTGAAPARHGCYAQCYAGMLLATRLVGCSDFHQACSGRAGGVALVVRHTLPCERLSLLAPTAWRPPPSACAHLPAPACTW
ncbi:hypothetical protein BCY84_07556 [Trypanosoma cruzi cruzi]|nr:hypothetical protein BCY84_07556 [Trypanosoma cruzi cruzi]